MALIPVGLVIIPLNKLTILLLLVLAADVAVALLLAEDLRQYRPAYRTRGTRQPFHRVCHWTAATTRANQMAVNFEVAELDDQTMNAGGAALINRYWARQGIVIELAEGKGTPLRSNLQPNGLPRGIAAKMRSR
jgi:hypothetical protein